MEFDEVVRLRRMVRNYADDPVDGELLDRILDRAQRAPSAGFSQGVSFVVVTDEERRAEIARLGHEDEYLADGFDPWISRAPVHVVICVSMDAYLERYREEDKGGPDGRTASEEGWPIPYWWVDAGASMMLLLLAVVDEGLAAGFLGSHNLGELSTLLDIPDHVAPIGVVTIGHAAGDRRSGSLARGRRSDAIHREHWEAPAGD
ncbi:MAG: nitroreductase family protein [Actinomycetota bacterium]|nr:nitroreductase family protein [Actinomycetota bacterium]